MEIKTHYQEILEGTDLGKTLELETKLGEAEKDVIVAIQKQVIASQSETREKYIAEGKLIPANQDLAINRKPKFSYNNKFDLIQLLFCDVEHYVEAAPGENSDELIDGLIFDPVKLLESDGIHFKRL